MLSRVDEDPYPPERYSYVTPSTDNSPQPTSFFFRSVTFPVTSFCFFCAVLPVLSFCFFCVSVAAPADVQTGCRSYRPVPVGDLLKCGARSFGMVLRYF